VAAAVIADFCHAAAVECSGTAVCRAPCAGRSHHPVAGHPDRSFGEDSMSEAKEATPTPADIRSAANTIDEINFWVIRGKAIQSYAFLEQALFQLFCALSGMDMKTAGTMFFRINNTRARNTIIEKLFRNKFADQMRLFRNSLISGLSSMDQQRNEIVHWHAVSDFLTRDANGFPIQQNFLEPP
jgi:hypothetical protein